MHAEMDAAQALNEYPMFGGMEAKAYFNFRSIKVRVVYISHCDCDRSTHCICTVAPKVASGRSEHLSGVCIPVSVTIESICAISLSCSPINCMDLRGSMMTERTSENLYFRSALPSYPWIIASKRRSTE